MPAVPAIVLAVVLAGCGSGSSSSSSGTSSSSASTAPLPANDSTGAPSVSSGNLSGIGQALVTAQGRALYVFLPDKHAAPTCVNTCARVWPPVRLAAGQKATVSGQARSSLLGSDPDPEGGRVLTYAGWPLYTYVADSVAGQASGQGLETNGGLWYVIAPSGKVITKSP